MDWTLVVDVKHYSFNSGHREGSQPFTVDHLFQAFKTLDMQLTCDREVRYGPQKITVF